PIRDHRAVGGARAQWLYDKLQKALTEAGASLVGHGQTFGNDSVAIDGIVGGKIYTREGFEKLLEVTLEIEAGGAVRGAEAVTFPAAFSPEVDPETYLPAVPEGDRSVKLHLDYRPGGGFCHGERFQMWLETTEDLYVRLITLYGKGSGLVTYPMEGQPELIEAGEPVSIGEFQAVAAQGPPVERWVVLAAPTREKLGKFKSAEPVCKLPNSFAGDLQDGRGLTTAVRKHLDVQTYRIMRETDRCSDVEIDERVVERADEALAETGFCWADEKQDKSTTN
ncbi:MAG: hypothetical protein ABEK29_00635, partial [Bradymonadaceae bacterium]